jgi:transposase
MARRFVREMSEVERASVEHLYRSSPDAVFVRRCHAVLLSADGRPVPEIARILRVDQSAVHRWLDRFEAGGTAGLVSVWSDGRPPCWDEEYEVLLLETVRHDPRWYGLEQSGWTCAALAGYLAEKTGIALSAERVRVLAHQHGLRLKQPTPVVHSRDPQYHPKESGLR